MSACLGGKSPHRPHVDKCKSFPDAMIPLLSLLVPNFLLTSYSEFIIDRKSFFLGWGGGLPRSGNTVQINISTLNVKLFFLKQGTYPQYMMYNSSLLSHSSVMLANSVPVFFFNLFYPIIILFLIYYKTQRLVP